MAPTTARARRSEDGVPLFPAHWEPNQRHPVGALPFETDLKPWHNAVFGRLMILPTSSTGCSLNAMPRQVRDDDNRKRCDQGNGGRLDIAQGVSQRRGPLLDIRPKETLAHCVPVREGKQLEDSSLVEPCDPGLFEGHPQSFVIKRRVA